VTWAADCDAEAPRAESWTASCSFQRCCSPLASTVSSSITHKISPNNMPFSSLQRKKLIIICLFIVLCALDRRRRRNRFYLTRSTLPPTPRANTAWQHLFESRDDRAWILTMGVGVKVFEKILAAGFAEAWTSTPIPRNDVGVSSVSWPRNRKRSLDAAGALGLALHHVNSTMADFSLQQIFGLTPAVCSRYRNWAFCLLQTTLQRFKAAQIRWPGALNCERFAAMISRRHPRLEKAIGFVDGCHLPIACSNDLDVQNAYYNGWCASHFTSNIFVFAPDGTIIHATINAPGSWHDAAVSRDLFAKLLKDTPADYWVIGDTAFPTSTEIQGRIRTPPKSNFKDYPTNPVELSNFLRFCDQLVSARQAAEWGMRCLQGSFGRLKMPMPADDATYRQRLLEICCRLHNVRTRLEGINQIKTVYEGVWKSTGDYTEFGELLFRDVKKNDRIRRFYNFVP
jgi:hypothetical protein